MRSRVTTAGLLVAALVAGLHAQQPTIDELLTQAEANIREVRARLTIPPPPSAPLVLYPGDALPTLLAALPEGAIVRVDPLFTYAGAVTITKPVSLIGPLGLGRVSETETLPSIIGPFTVAAPGVYLEAIQFTNPNVDQAIVTLQGAGTILHRVRVLGDPVKGQRRGIAGNAPNVTVRHSFVDYIFHVQDAQAFIAWDSPGPFTLDDNTFSASGQSVMFGGADASSEANIPSDIMLTHSTLTKRLEWKGKAGLTVKNAFELKNARRVHVEGNIIERSWRNGQTGFLVVLTPRNQDGKNPYAVVEDVRITKNQIRDGAALVQILGRDSLHPSQPLRRVTMTDNHVTGIDPVAWNGGDPRLLLIVNGSEDVTITGNSVDGQNIRTGLALSGDANPSTNLMFTGNRFPHVQYKILGERDWHTMISGASVVSVAANTWAP